MGKFTQSVRRIVQDVRDDGTTTGQSKDEVLRVHQSLRATRLRLETSYNIAKESLVNLHKEYEDSKSLYVFSRYGQLKKIIKPVIRLEREWTLLEVPKQEKAEPINNYVLRACSCLEKVTSKGHSGDPDDNEERDERERLEDMTSVQIDLENTVSINHLYKLLKRYGGLRNLIRDLTRRYAATKYYPIFPRYFLLKNMIKTITHDPNYMEVCHEHININNVFDPSE